MKIRIVTVGKIKEKYLRDAIDEYSKRIGGYAKLEIIEVSDEKTPDNASFKEEENIKIKEGKKIIYKIGANDYVIVLAIDGKSFSSEEFSKYIFDLTVKSISTITFVIGGSLGLSKEVLDRGDLAISFSKMTFTHQIMRVILLEQIYRAIKIEKNEPYHK